MCPFNLEASFSELLRFGFCTPEWLFSCQDKKKEPHFDWKMWVLCFRQFIIQLPLWKDQNSFKKLFHSHGVDIYYLLFSSKHEGTRLCLNALTHGRWSSWFRRSSAIYSLHPKTQDIRTFKDQLKSMIKD